ncbi:hypothetical protein GCM10011351_31280 [Paraliobacillus quinghaiensis]|uniref:PepSY domain-containing protein n=1 Tax=Paraliobacillus quinghaiensis TaxID=470815 RepID=A0A917WYZ0_9BACI|nr:PepSY domain-containing protein [Paraliobacillus quinghaiensis]GGM43062.1 hypothetical protein GCM10011351_31280 [Paraliobacillus quinghaiensis]
MKKVTLIFSLLLFFVILVACDSKQEPNYDKNSNNNDIQKEENQKAQIPSEEISDEDANEKNSETQAENDDSIVEFTQMFFHGKSENWEGQLISSQQYFNFEVFYILNEPEVNEINTDDIGNVKYKIKTENKTIEGEGKLVGNSIPLDNNKISLPYKDETISVTVEWKGKKEMFTMVNKLEEEGVMSSKRAIDIAKEQMRTDSIDFPIVEARYRPFDKTWRVLAQQEGNDYYFIKIHAKSGEIVEYEGYKGNKSYHSHY